MTSTYDARGRRVGATILEIAPNSVTQVKTVESKDGYDAVQLGFGSKKSVKKPQLGHAKKVGLEQPLRWFREVRIKEDPKAAIGTIEPGQQINVGQVFSIGDAVKVQGTSKGKGFQGGVRRHGFHGGPKTHGQSDRHRAPGAIGSGTTPGRVLKGKKMAGHMGNATITVKGLEVVNIDKEKNLLVVKGAVPGYAGSLLTITKLGRIKGYTPPPEEKPSEEEQTESSNENQESREKPAEKSAEQTAETLKEGEENAG